MGRYVVEALRAQGDEPAVLARARGVDLRTGAGLDAAMAGAAALVDVSNITTARGAAAEAFFRAVTQRLLDAGERAGVGHHVVLSVVGVDRVPWGYYRAKLRQEEAARAGPVPATVLRATQFHEFAGQLLDRSRGPVAVLPRMRVQPVAAREVGAALAALAVAPPAAAAEPAELAGPEVHGLIDLARRTVRARGGRTRVLGVRLPGAAGRQLTGGGLLPGPGARRVGPAFADWLAAGGAGGAGAAG